MAARTKNIKLQYYIEYGLVRLLRLILLSMPIDMASFLMGKVWRIFGPFNIRHKRALRHIEWAMGDQYGAMAREKIIRNMWENIGRTFAEGLISDRIVKDAHRFNVTTDVFSSWKESCTNGSVLVTHHFGNWELAAVPPVFFANHNVSGLYRRIKNPLVESFFLSVRSDLFPGGLYSQQRGSAMHAVEQLKRGQDVSMVMDLRDGRGVNVELFDMPAMMSTFPAQLALKYQKPLFIGQMRRTAGAHFELDLVRINHSQINDQKRETIAITQAIHSQFEAWIRENPDQWMWASYRWTGRRDEVKKPESWQEFMMKSKDATKS